MIHDLLQDVADPVISCQIDFANALQTTHRQLSTGDCILDKASRTYDDGRVKSATICPNSLSSLKPFFPYGVEVPESSTNKQHTLSSAA
jgi:hypothetical protein